MNKDTSGFDNESKQSSLQSKKSQMRSESISSNQIPRLLTISECAAILRISKAQAYRLAETKKLPVIRISERRMVVAEEDLIKFLKRRRQEEPGQLVFMLDGVLNDGT